MRKYSEDDVKENLLAAAGRQGFNQWLAPNLVSANRQGVELSLMIRPDMTQHHGFVHGGCVSALGDTACAWAGAMTSGQDVVTASFSIQFIAPATGSHLRAMAKTIKSGRTLASVEVKIYTESENQPPKICAAGLASIAILQGE